MGIKTKKNTRGFGMGVILRLSCTWGTFPGATGPVSFQLNLFSKSQQPDALIARLFGVCKEFPERRAIWLLVHASCLVNPQ